MNLTVTLLVTKAASLASRVLGRGGGGALPGLIAERLDPNLAAKLAAKLPHGVILVTGTNGKTTTTKLITDMLEASGERVLSNRSGSNLKRGVVSALIKAATLGGKLDATVGLFEVDEASLRLVAPLVKPRHIVVLNLFRDQLDRYGELDTLAAIIGQGIGTTEAELHLNADDPLVASLARYARRPELVHYFGIEGLPASAATQATAADSDRCPVCGTRLVFSRVFYGHIGHYRCPTGDFDRPQPAVAITSVDRADLGGSQFTVAIRGKRHAASLPLPGTYNLYNALAATALADGWGLAPSLVLRCLAAATAAFGRVEQLEVGGRPLYLLLIKNPAGFTQVLETFLLPAKQPQVLILVNDNLADGRDVSWLWDVPLESLAVTGAVVTVGGIRGADMALRLKYAGIAAEFHEGIDEALKAFLGQIPVGETGYILPTYTAMIDVRQQLSHQAELAKVAV